MAAQTPESNYQNAQENRINNIRQQTETIEQLNELKQGRVTRSYNGKIVDRGYDPRARRVKDLEIRVEKARLILNDLNDQMDVAANNKKVRGGKYDPNAIRNNPIYEKAKKDYDIAKVDLDQARRLQRQDTNLAKLAYLQFETDGTANYIRGKEKAKHKSVIEKQAIQATHAEEKVKFYENRLPVLKEYEKKAKPGTPGAYTLKAEIERDTKELNNYRNILNNSRAEISKAQRSLDAVDGKSLIQGADNRARARKANKSVPKLSRKRRK